MKRLLVGLCLFFFLAVSWQVGAVDIRGYATVIDGDTIEIQGNRIRLNGIDTPEKEQTCERNGTTWQCGSEATKLMRTLTRGLEVACKGSTKDQYGRVIANCFVEGANINARMVESGMALAYRLYSTEYVQNEDRARLAGRGLWEGDFISPWDWRSGKRLNKDNTTATSKSTETSTAEKQEETEPTQTTDTSLELEFWQSIKESDDPEAYQAYLETYPEGAFVSLAKLRVNTLSGTTDVGASGIPDLNYGRYFALVIGNNDYQDLPNLQTAINDAQGVASLLENEYYFEVNLLKNATRSDIVDTLARLRKTVGSQDNLLIYYAGHGVLDEVINKGYWLPVDADRESPSNWIQSDTIVAQIRGMQAKHVMVVADSCFSGALTRGFTISQQTSDDYLEKMVKKRARTVLTSGGLEPVMDSGGSGHSVFARALLTLLKENTGVLDASQLFSKLRPKVMRNSNQTPEYNYVHQAGHDGGDFLFVKNDQRFEGVIKPEDYDKVNVDDGRTNVLDDKVKIDDGRSTEANPMDAADPDIESKAFPDS